MLVALELVKIEGTLKGKKRHCNQSDIELTQEVCVVVSKESEVGRKMEM